MAVGRIAAASGSPPPWPTQTFSHSSSLTLPSAGARPAQVTFLLQIVAQLVARLGSAGGGGIGCASVTVTALDFSQATRRSRRRRRRIGRTYSAADATCTISKTRTIGA